MGNGYIVKNDTLKGAENWTVNNFVWKTIFNKEANTTTHTPSPRSLTQFVGWWCNRNERIVSISYYSITTVTIVLVTIAINTIATIYHLHTNLSTEYFQIKCQKTLIRLPWKSNLKAFSHC